MLAGLLRSRGRRSVRGVILGEEGGRKERFGGGLEVSRRYIRNEPRDQFRAVWFVSNLSVLCVRRDVLEDDLGDVWCVRDEEIGEYEVGEELITRSVWE